MFKNDFVVSKYFSYYICVENLPPIVGALNTLTVKKYVPGIQNTMASAEDKYNSLLREIRELVDTVNGERDFSADDQIQAVKGERRDGKKNWDAKNYAKLRGIISN